MPDKDKAHALGFTKTPGINLVLPTTVLPCQYKLSYFWLNNKLAFWCKPVTIDQSSVDCWIWNGTNWNSSKLQLSDIDTFICGTF
jgi:hypothetical protein